MCEMSHLRSKWDLDHNIKTSMNNHNDSDNDLGVVISLLELLVNKTRWIQSRKRFTTNRLDVLVWLSTFVSISESKCIAYCIYRCAFGLCMKYLTEMITNLHNFLASFFDYYEPWGLLSVLFFIIKRVRVGRFSFSKAY